MSEIEHTIDGDMLNNCAFSAWKAIEPLTNKNRKAAIAYLDSRTNREEAFKKGLLKKSLMEAGIECRNWARNTKYKDSNFAKPHYAGSQRHD